MIDIPDQTGQPKLSPISQTFSRLSEKLPTKTITKTAIFQESQAGQLLMTHLHALAAFGTSVASVSCAERKNSSVEIHCILAHVSLSLSLSLCGQSTSVSLLSKPKQGSNAYVHHFCYLC